MDYPINKISACLLIWKHFSGLFLLFTIITCLLTHNFRENDLSSLNVDSALCCDHVKWLQSADFVFDYLKHSLPKFFFFFFKISVGVVYFSLRMVGLRWYQAILCTSQSEGFKYGDFKMEGDLISWFYLISTCFIVCIFNFLKLIWSQDLIDSIHMISQQASRHFVGQVNHS